MRIGFLYNIAPNSSGSKHVNGLVRYLSQYEHCDLLTVDSNFYGFDLLIVSGYTLLESVRQIQTPIIYYMNTMEPDLYPLGEYRLRAELAIRSGYPILVHGKWLQKELYFRYGINSAMYGFGVSAKFKNYNISRKKQIIFYCPERQERCPVLGTEILYAVKERISDCSIVLFGNTKSRVLGCGEVWAGILTEDELVGLYNESMIGLNMTLSNPSSMALEMLACGLKVIDLNVDNNKYDFSNIILAGPHPDNIAQTIYEEINKDSIGSFPILSVEYTYEEAYRSIKQLLSIV